ncbi:MAG: hypothetical protein JRE82_16835 [Deltaproteobacteria bacterium]|nr:hypothetical protein [Deltaproteobacteria bacterium]
MTLTSHAAAALFLDLGLETLELLGPGAPAGGDGADLHQELRVFRDRGSNDGQGQSDERSDEENRISHERSF